MEKWKDVYERLYGDSNHGIPDAESVDIGKLAGQVMTTDTCNTAQKVQRLLGDEVKKANPEGADAFQEACHGHLRNIWSGGATKALSKYLTTFLKDNIDEIDDRLRVGCSVDSCLRATEKNFGRTNNYAKGDGEDFHPHMDKYHAGALLINLERVVGSCQDVAMEGSCAVYWNRPFYVEFLFERLRINDSDHILRENLYIILTSMEMTALFRVMAIFHLSVVVPHRWLVSNVQNLRADDFSLRSLGRVIDKLESTFEQIVNKTKSILDEDFMMGIFDTFKNEIPKLNDFLDYKYNKYSAKVVGDSKECVLPYAMLRNELFSPRLDTNRETNSFAEIIGRVAAEAMLSELRDPHKVTSKYLSSLDGERSWKNTPLDIHRALLGKYGVNDPAERAFGSGTNQLQVYGRIALPSAFAMGQMKTNGDLARNLNIGKKNQDEAKDGFFHSLSDDPVLADKLKTSLLVMCLEESPITTAANKAALEKQRKARLHREELTKRLCLEKATLQQIAILTYYEMYHEECCWRTAKDVSDGLKSLKTKTSKLHAVKENISIRVVGFGWQQFHHQWSKNGVDYTIDELAKHLKHIICEEKKLGIPVKPPIEMPLLREMPKLGQLTADAKALHEKLESESQDFVVATRDRRRELESEGMGDRHQEFQPHMMPDLYTLARKKKRIDMYCKYDTIQQDGTGETVMRWCQGEVRKVSDGKSMYKPGTRQKFKAGEAVMVLWDPIPEIDEPSQEYAVRLLPTKWNPKNVSENAWRLDVKVDY